MDQTLIGRTDGFSWFDATFAHSRVMAILRNTGAERALRLSEKAWELGIDNVEVTIQSPGDEEALRVVAARAHRQGRRVGAGTIIAPSQVAVAHDLGADFLVSPGLDPLVIAAARDLGMPILPGVATPSEVQVAVSMGLSWLKAFPATWLGPAWFQHIRGPFPQVQFVATGGLDATNIHEFLHAGVRVVAVGSALEQDDQQLARLALLVEHPLDGGASLGSSERGSGA